MTRSKVLIVEDEPIVAMDLQQEVQDLGYDVVGTAESADEALMIIQSNLPDIALMDIRIVGSMDGIQTARALSHWYHIPSVFLTSYSDDTTLARAARIMPYGYLTKPFRGPDLAATLRMALEKARSEVVEQSEQTQAAETINAMHEAIVTVNSTGTIRFMNYAAEALTGWNASAAKGRRVHEVLQWSGMPTDPVPSLSDWTEMSEGEWLGCPLAQFSGGKCSVDITLGPLTDSDGEHRGFVLTLRDATDRMRRQAIDEVQNGGSYFDHAPMAMIQLDDEGRIQRVNEALLTETGVAAEKVVGRTLTGLSLDPDPRIAKELIPKLLNSTTVITAKPQMAN